MANPTPIKVIIADDQRVFRIGLTALINDMQGVELLDEASNGEELIEKALLQKPDVIITDIKMPVLDGISATKELNKQIPNSKIIALSAYVKDDLILHMLESGAIGYLVKTADAHEIKEAIETVNQHKPYFCKEITQRLTEIVARNYKLPEKSSATFTERELDIIRLICKEFTSKEIAMQLHLSKRTVEGHRTRILEKMNVKSIAGLITYAFDAGIYRKEVS
ncbi:MAG: response regulator transcription factor [Sphingobacteriia bacterium]